MSDLIIRPYRTQDAGALACVFHRAVRRGTRPHYSLVQRIAWSPRVQPPAAWDERLSAIETLVAEREGRPVGFMAMDLADGFLDFAYVAPEARRQGVAAALYAVIEGRVRVAGRTVLEAEASRVAEPFFAARGWQVSRRQSVRRLGLQLPNAVMHKTLIPAQVAA